MSKQATEQSKDHFPSGRQAGLDALRAGAMLLGILLHASMAYTPTPIRHLLWPVMDEPKSWLCDLVYWSVHAFRLPLFFFLSGFFAEQVYQARGVRLFVDQRVRRLAIPYAVSSVTILPLCFLVWTTGWVIAGRSTIEHLWNPLLPFEPELQANYFNPGHLWFLLDLMVFNAAYLAFRLESPKEPDVELSQRLWQLGPFALPLVLSAPMATLLWGNSDPVTAFHNSFLPDASRLVYYGLYFTIGAHAYRNRNAFSVAIRPWPGFLAGGVAAIAVALRLVKSEVTGESSVWLRGLFGWSIALAAWFMILGSIGFVIRHVRESRPGIRYLADSSYWMYLIHFPLVGLTHIALRPQTWTSEWKMLATFTITALVSFASYAAFVRHTVIGATLHGRRERGPLSPSETETNSAGLRKAA